MDNPFHPIPPSRLSTPSTSYHSLLSSPSPTTLSCLMTWCDKSGTCMAPRQLRCYVSPTAYICDSTSETALMTTLRPLPWWTRLRPFSSSLRHPFRIKLVHHVPHLSASGTARVVPVEPHQPLLNNVHQLAHNTPNQWPNGNMAGVVDVNVLVL